MCQQMAPAGPQFGLAECKREQHVAVTLHPAYQAPLTSGVMAITRPLGCPGLDPEAAGEATMKLQASRLRVSTSCPVLARVSGGACTCAQVLVLPDCRGPELLADPQPGLRRLMRDWCVLVQGITQGCWGSSKGLPGLSGRLDMAVQEFSSLMQRACRPSGCWTWLSSPTLSMHKGCLHTLSVGCHGCC